MQKTPPKYLVFVIVFLVATTCALPHIYGYFKYRTQYTPFNLYQKNQYQRDELYAYASQAQQLLKGHLVGDSYTWEGRAKPSPFLSEFVSVLPISVLSLITGNIKFAFVASDFIFPALLFILIFFQLRKNYHYLTSLAAASAVILLPFISTLLPFFSKGGYLWTGTVNDPLLITRTPHPQISLVFLFLAIFAAASSLNFKKNKSLIPIAIIAAVSLYTSVFISSTVILALIILSPLLLKNTKNSEILLSFLVFLLISLPWIINFLSYNKFLHETDFFLRASYSKEILFPRQLRYLVFAFILYLISKSSISKTIIAFALSAGILMDFHQVLLGRSVDADHWISRVIAPVATLAIFLAFGLVIKKTKQFKPMSLIVLITVLFLGIYFQIKWINKNMDLLVSDASKAEIFEKIKTATKKDDVIAATALDLNQFIPGATGRYIYIGPPERALLNNGEHLKRICDVYRIAKDKNLSSIPDDLLDLEISFQKWKLNKEVNKDMFTKDCFEQKKGFYKIDYIVDKKPDGRYELIKY